MKCEFCHEFFPGRFHLPFFVNGVNHIADPLCALKEVRRVHKSPRYNFHGPVATQTLKEYLEWKSVRTNPATR